VAAPLTLFEAILRWTDPLGTAPPNGRVGQVVYTWGHPAARNRYGFRDRDFAVPKPNGVFRIMVLGDSFTWEVGLSAEQRYTDLLEEILREARPELRAEVLNFGMPGIGTVHEMALLHVYQDVVDPDLIAVGFCLNDPQSEAMDHSPERDSWRPRLAWMGPSLARIGLRETGRRLEAAGWRVVELLGLVPTWMEALDHTHDEPSREWQEFRSALWRIRTISDQRGLPEPLFAVLNQGSVHGAPTDYRDPDETLRTYLRWYQQAEDAARGLGFFAYDHSAEIARELPARNLSVNAWDGHPSSELHALYARRMADVILREVPPRVSR
jgi:lysophospholipase L1-like esterase